MIGKMVFQIRPAVIKGKDGFVAFKVHTFFADKALCSDDTDGWGLFELGSDDLKYSLERVHLFETTVSAANKVFELYGTKSRFIDYLG